MASLILPDDWEDRAVSRLLDIPDDSKFICEAMARLEFRDDFCNLSVADQSLILGLAIYIKRTRQNAEVHKA